MYSCIRIQQSLRCSVAARAATVVGIPNLNLCSKEEITRSNYIWIVIVILTAKFQASERTLPARAIFRRLYERSIPERYHSSSLSLCVIFSRHIYFFLSRSHTHTIFLHLSQIFKANINAALFALAMKIKGGTEDCFPVFLFLFLISFFTLSHTNESYRHQASVACMR